MRESAPLAAETLYGAILDSWLGGASHALAGLPPDWKPPVILAPPPGPPGQPPSAPPSAGDFFDGGEPPIGVHLVAIENAIAALSAREVLQPDDYYALAGEAKQKAFTITAGLTDESLKKFRDALAADVTEGPSLGSFRDRVLEEFDVLPLAENHLEQVFRNNVNEAFSQGMEQILDHPLVEDAFPYRRYVPIHDARCRPEHTELEKLGLDSTSVYYKDDPTWFKFRPPWDWNCRCGWIAISTETAAEMGVAEAKRWLADIDAAEEAGTYNGLPSSVEPIHQWVKPPPFLPPPEWRR